jgi:hypothetical protein
VKKHLKVEKVKNFQRNYLESEKFFSKFSYSYFLERENWLLNIQRLKFSGSGKSCLQKSKWKMKIKQIISFIPFKKIHPPKSGKSKKFSTKTKLSW